MNYELQVVTVPVTDVNRAAAFYTQQAGFRLDVDYQPTADFRVLQEIGFRRSFS
jgi:catechol 2,3-dioxygenase-like lactoylglutathione lyase family enzyme